MWTANDDSRWQGMKPWYEKLADQTGNRGCGANPAFFGQAQAIAQSGRLNALDAAASTITLPRSSNYQQEPGELCEALRSAGRRYGGTGLDLLSCQTVR